MTISLSTLAIRRANLCLLSPHSLHISELSNAYKPGALGSVMDERLGEREPLPIERERALGYEAGSTAAPGLSQRARHEVTGRCIDANAAEHLMAWICALYSCGDDALHHVAGVSATPSWGPQLTAWASRSEMVQHYSLPAVSMLEKLLDGKWGGLWALLTVGTSVTQLTLPASAIPPGPQIAGAWASHPQLILSLLSQC
jgi:hypothetical protein